MAEIAAEGEPTTSAGHPETQSPEPGAKGGVVPRTPRASARNVAPTSAYRDVLRREWDPAPQATTQVGPLALRQEPSPGPAPGQARRMRQHRGVERDASLLLSGSDDLCVCVWSVGTSFPCLGTVYTGHNHNIFSAEFVPGTRGGRCVTTAGDGDVRVVDLVGDPNPREAEATPRSPRRTEPISNPPLRLRRRQRRRRRRRQVPLRGQADGPERDRRRHGHEGSIRPGAPDVLLATHQDGRVRRFDLRLAPRATGDVVVDLSVQGGCSDLAFDPSSPSLFALGDATIRSFASST